jgi:hypothetical protein
MESKKIHKVAVKVKAKKTEEKLLLPKVRIGNELVLSHGNRTTIKSFLKNCIQA